MVASLHAVNRVWHAIVLIRLLVFKIGSREEDGCVPSGNGRRKLEVPSIALRGLRGRPARFFKGLGYNALQ